MLPVWYAVDIGLQYTVSCILGSYAISIPDPFSKVVPAAPEVDSLEVFNEPVPLVI